jgi:hypothetical protein
VGKIVIEYRYAASKEKRGRRNTSEMRYYLETLVDEMSSVGMDAEYVDSIAVDGEVNSVTVNGTDIISIAEDIDLMMIMLGAYDPDPNMHQMTDIFGKQVMDWNREYVEDIPEILMNSAVSKVCSKMNEDVMRLMLPFLLTDED